MLFDKKKMPTAADALKGRAEKMPVPPTHHVLKGARLEPPFPASTQHAMFGLGCFWGAEKKFWHCVRFGDTPRLFGVDPPRPRIEAVRCIDMASSNAWAEFAALFCSTRPALLEHERAKIELKALMPEDAKEAFGHGVRAKRSKAGAVSFEEIKTVEADDAPVK